jgi:WD40 repeat protein
LAVGSGPTIKLWDVAGNRLRATLDLETERFTVNSVAYSPDGRTLAVAGSTLDLTKKSQKGEVRLFDVAAEPLRERAVLSFERDDDTFMHEVPRVCSDVVFTPDGRRVIAVAVDVIKTWDVATAVVRDVFWRGGASSSYDRLAVSPDGPWLAITGAFEVDIVDIPPP